MIIGINGYIGSGKDTVGKIIQYLTDEYWHGRTYLEDRSFDAWMKPNLHPSGYDISGHKVYHAMNNGNWQIKKFAGKLKEIASILTGIPIEKFEDQEFKKTYLGDEWDYEIPYESHAPWVAEGEKTARRMTVREFLQSLGTEAIRYGLHPNAWVNALFVDYLDEYNPVQGKIQSNWIITDVRFRNEAEAVQIREGVVIRVNKEDNENPFKNIKTRIHVSERQLDNWNFDYVIDNNGTIEELIEKVRKMLIHFNILKYETTGST